MERDGSVIGEASKLEVFAPTSPLERSEHISRVRSERRSRRVGQNENEVPLPPAIQATIQARGSAPKTQAAGFLGGPADQQIVATAHDGTLVEVEAPKTIMGAILALPSWLVSFVVHLTLLLILALCTFSSELPTSIFLEMAEISSEQYVTMTMDIELDDSQLEESAEMLDVPENLDDEMPELDLQDPVVEMFDAEDPFEVKELAEFASAESKLPPAGGDASGEGMAANGGAGGEGVGTEFFGTKAYGSDFVFVIDASSSMRNQYRWTRAVRELLETLDQLEKGKNFMVILYNDRSFMMFGAPEDQKLIPATVENKRKISQWLAQAQPFGGTQPGKSMRLALKKAPDAIYFLSDGELRDNTMFDLRTWNKAKKGKDGLERKISIHTIMLGSNSGFRTMEAIAKENNGIFTRVN